jgi:hypothetical protein
MTARSGGPAPVIAVIAVTMGCAAAHDRLPPTEPGEILPRQCVRVR